MLAPFTLHSRFGRALTVGVAACFLVVLVVSAFAGRWLDVLLLLAPLGLVSFATWATFWRPAVHVDDAGVSVRNVFRTIDVAWPEIVRIDTKYALRFDTVHGPVTAWAAPAPGRHSIYSATKQDGGNLPESTYINGTVRPGDLITSDSGQAAFVIRTRWEALRDAGHLDAQASEFTRLRTTWHVRTLVSLAALIATSMLSALV
jgi:hypothetical protein